MYYNNREMEFWVPYPEKYHEEFANLQTFDLENLNLTKEEIDKASEEKKDFLTSFTNNCDKKDFKFLLENLFLNNKDNKKTKFLYEMINLFPPSIKEKLKNEPDKIEYKWMFYFWNKEINKWICYF
jgi:hypothetical protein